MAVNQEDISKILSTLSHPLRREILIGLSDKGELSFTDLLNMLNVDTGKLSFHLRSLDAFIEQTASGKYKLNRTGENAIRVVRDIESWVEAADIQRKESTLRLASLRKRTYAFLIDFGIILAITATTTFVPQVLTFSLDTLLKGGLSAALFITMGLLWLYSTLLEGFNGQSIGKRVIGLKVVRTDGKKMSYDHAAIRNFGKILPILPFDLLIGIWRIPDRSYMRYFDKFAGTTVIDLRPPNSNQKVTINPAEQPT